MGIVTQTLDYRDAETELAGYLAYDSGWSEPRPAVIVAHAWAGRNEFACEKARAMADLGYVGFALDMYGKGVLGGGAEENAELMRPFIEDRGLLQRRIGLALDTVGRLERVDGDRIAAIGYCFGGLCVLDLARSGADLRAVVSFHGLLKPPAASATSICASILVLHGHEDPMAPPEDVAALENELTGAGSDWQIHVYGGTLHAFTNPEANDRDFGTVYDAGADRRSWQSMKWFLEESFARQRRE